MKKFLIAEAEKARILGMHYKAMGKSLVNEEEYKPEVFRKAGIQQYVPITASQAKLGNYDVSFTENTNFKTYRYQCAPISDPDYAGLPWNKTGAIYDSADKLVNDPFVLSNTPEFKKIMAGACRAVFTHIAQQKAKNAPQPQVAAATTAKVTAPNPNSSAQLDAEAQKRQADAKAKRQQQMTEFQKLISTPGFLDSTKDDTTLDNEVTQLSKYLGLQFKPLDSEGIRSLLTSMSRLVKAKPKYGAEPYGLTDYINTLRTEL